MYITKFAIPEIIFGQGSLSQTGKCALYLGARRVFLVSDQGIEAVGWVEKTMDILQKEGVSITYFSGLSANPKDFEIEEGARLYKEKEADVIIALGGGSVLDTAKAIAILVSNGGKIQDYEGANKVTYPLPPMILITTTAGSGSDISQFCIITDTARKIKMSIITRTIVPNIAIVDPLLLQTKSRNLLILSAIDALAHAIEAYLSSIASPFTETHSQHAIKLIYEYLQKAIDHRCINDLEKLSTASVSASMAFSNASLGAEHALAHAIGGYFDTAHGAVHPILLPAVMHFNMEYRLEKIANIASILGVQKQATLRATACAGIAKLETFFKNLSVATHLSEVITETPPHSLEYLSKIAAQDSCLLTNPRPTSWQDLYNICKKVW